VLDSLDNLSVLTKISQEFFSAPSYTENDYQTFSTFDANSTPLSQNMLQHQTYRVDKTHVLFQNLFFYSDNLIQSFTEFDVFDHVRDGTWSYQASSRDNFSIP